jgi:hypothetical protein
MIKRIMEEEEPKKYFHKVTSDSKQQIQWAQRTKTKINVRKTISRYIILKLQKIKA